MSLARQLFINWDTKKLQVSDTSAIPYLLPAFQKYENVPFEVVIVQPTEPWGPNDFKRVDITDLSLKMAINDSYDDATPLAEQASWNKNTGTSVFNANFNLNTAAINTYLGAVEEKTPYFEVEALDGTGARTKLYTATVKLRQGVLQTVTTPPSEMDVYYTAAQIHGLFVPRIVEAGETLTFTSPNGVIHRVLGVRDDGSPQDDIY